MDAENLNKKEEYDLKKGQKNQNVESAQARSERNRTWNHRLWRGPVRMWGFAKF